MLLQSIEHQQNELRQQLKLAIEDLKNAYQTGNYDFIVSHSEVNDRHGVGVLLKRIFRNDQNIVSIRSRNLYDGIDDFGNFNFLIHHDNYDINAIYEQVRSTLGNLKPKRILCIPYFLDDILTAIAIKDIFDVPLCSYLMDDQNIYINEIPDKYMSELLHKSDLCFGISRNLCQAYEQKYNKKIWFVPPVAPEQLIIKDEVIFPSQVQEAHGVLVGNIWSQKWLDQLRETVRGSGVKIEWYGNPHRDWLKFEETELAQDGIIFKGYLENETDLVEKLREASFAIIPTADKYSANDRLEIAKLSLPSRIPFLVATAHLPLLVMGDKDTAAAQFVTDFQLGTVGEYNPLEFKQKLAWIMDKENQQSIRNRGAKLAQPLSSEGIKDWIWDSLARKEPKDKRFEKLGQFLNDATVILTPNEVNQQHGTGALVKRIIADTPNIYSIRSDNHYGGIHNFGEISYCLPQKGISRLEAFKIILTLLEDIEIKQAFCVPYYTDDLYLSIAVKELFNVPLGVYIMDDQNIVANNIPDDLMREFLSKCSFRLATHPELRDVYENKYGMKFYLLPAVVPDHLINNKITTPDENLLRIKKGALIGSIWSNTWFEMLTDTVKGANLHLDWYGNYNYHWLTETPSEISEKRNVTPCGVVDENTLAEKLKQYPYVVVPTGTLDERDDRAELSILSLPGRIIFAMASSHTPVIILGSEKTSAGAFIKRFGIGVVSDYNPQSFQEAVEYVTQPDVQKQMRQKAASVAEDFSAKDINHWLWQSLQQGQPHDWKFEKLLPRAENDIVHFIEPSVPKDIYKDYVPVYYAIRRLHNKDYKPDFIVDVGSSHGIWSYTASKFFTDARFILIDPLMSKYEQAARDFYLQKIPNSVLLEVAISNKPGKTSFQVSPDLYGSSLLNPADFRSYETIKVDVLTLDQVAKNYQLSGRGILKLDVQCAEHIVLEGAKQFLDQVDAIVVELSLIRYDSNALIFLEMLELMQNLGFRYYDETGEWRSPVDGTLLQKEVVFLRNDLLVFQTSYTVKS